METIVQNVTISDIFIEDLGVLILPSESINLLELGYTKASIDVSDDLKNLVSSSDLVVNNGDVDLGIEDALEHLSLQSVYADDQDNPGIVPSGGTSNQVLVKASDQSFDLKWMSVTEGVLVLDPIEIPLNVKTEERRWETLATYMFPGTIALGDSPTKLDILNKIDRLELRGEFRVRGSGGTIASLSNLANIDWTTNTDTHLSNLTTEPLVWDVQLRVRRKYSGYCFRVSTMTIRFD